MKNRGDWISNFLIAATSGAGRCFSPPSASWPNTYRQCLSQFQRKFSRSGLTASVCVTLSRPPQISYHTHDRFWVPIEWVRFGFRILSCVWHEIWVCGMSYVGHTRLHAKISCRYPEGKKSVRLKPRIEHLAKELKVHRRPGRRRSPRCVSGERALLYSFEASELA